MGEGKIGGRRAVSMKGVQDLPGRPAEKREGKKKIDGGNLQR